MLIKLLTPQSTANFHLNQVTFSRKASNRYCLNELVCEQDIGLFTLHDAEEILELNFTSTNGDVFHVGNTAMKAITSRNCISVP